MKEIKEIIINGEEYALITDYKDTEKYRHSLNQLVAKTFSFDFEDWYQRGYWTDKYRPYSLVHREEIVANVSVNPIRFVADDVLVNTVQIGTVMTEEAYRHRGLSKILMEYILQEYSAACDLFYLYANHSAVDFYPKFGFERAKEYIYTKTANRSENIIHFRKLNLADAKDNAIISRLASNTKPVSRYQMIENPELLFFYLTSNMSDCIYYSEEADLAAVAEYGEEGMFLADVYCEKSFDIDEVISSLIRKDGEKVSLGFTPLDSSGFHCEWYQDEGTTFFVKGRDILTKGKFPVLSHA